jgi:hypothetical protein
MADLKAKKPAAESARGLPGIVHLGRSNCSDATTFRQQYPASARITARAEAHLSQVEWRIARIGALVAVGHADRSLVVERLGVAIELARLDVEVLP